MADMMTPQSSDGQLPTDIDALFEHTARLAVAYRQSVQRGSPYAKASVGQLREAFALPLADEGMGGIEVIDRLSAAAGPGLVGSTEPPVEAYELP